MTNIIVDKPTLILLGTFDTKPVIFNCLYNLLKRSAWDIVTINTGTFGSKVNFKVDFEADIVASHGGVSLQKLIGEQSRNRSVEVMGRGAGIICNKLSEELTLVGVLGAGGGGGTFMTLKAMQSVPFGVPKICISTMAAKDLSDQMGAKDVVLVPSIVDVSNMNSIIRPILERSTAMLLAMATQYIEESNTEHTVHKIALSMFGNTTPCVESCVRILEAKGIEAFTFHATGVGGRSMESLIDEELFDGVIDVTTTELADYLCGGVCDAGPDRLNAAVEKGIPQVVVPGCLDMVNFTYPHLVPAKYQGRTLYQWSPDVTLMRTNLSENIRLGKLIMEKLNRTKVPLFLVVPLQGLSAIDRAGNDFHDPEANNALFNTMRDCIGSDLIQYIELDYHINDPEFADQLITYYFRLVQHTE